MKKKVLWGSIVGICLVLCGLMWYIFAKYSLHDIKDAVYALSHKGEGELYADFGNRIGEIKALNGINNGPKSGYDNGRSTDEWELDATQLYQEMGIPIVRTHDSEYPYGQGQFVDIHCIFPDFTKNAEDESAYNFTYTDKYIEAIIDSGAEVFFRLGESIDHSGNNLYINPPTDYEKWAQICEHIILHYNEGWAEGFEYDIKYWEIWNEPDNPQNWTGTKEEYFELYKQTAIYLKDKFPDIYIGGYAAASCSSEIVSEFLQYIKEGEKAPLDFFSWHTYTSNPWIFWENAKEVRELLNQNGYENTKSILDEWNYLETWEDLDGAMEVIQSAKGAAFMASSMIIMQYSSIDASLYYDGQFINGWCGLYDSETETLPGYNVFCFFDQMYQQGYQVQMNDYVSEGLDGIYALAATGENSDSFLIANYNGESLEKPVEVRLRFEGDREQASVTRINQEHPEGITTNYQWFLNRAILNIEPGEVIFIELK